MEYFVYILKSDITGKFYIGQTQNLVEKINRHNSEFDSNIVKLARGLTRKIHNFSDD